MMIQIKLHTSNEFLETEFAFICNQKMMSKTYLKGRVIIMINNQKLRTFITPSHRLSVCVIPSAPHSVVINHLISLGIKSMSEMKFLSAGLSDKKYTHI